MKRCLLLAALAASAATAEKAPVTEIAFRKTDLAAAALTAKPTSIVADPAAAATVEHIRSQLKLMLADDYQRTDNPLTFLLTMLANEGQHWYLGFYGEAEMPNGRDQFEAMAFTFDIGDQVERMRSLSSRMSRRSDLKPMTVAGIEGHSMDRGRTFVGFDESNLVIGTLAEVPLALARRDALSTNATPASATWHGTHLMARLVTMSEVDDDAKTVFALFPEWRNQAPSATLTAGVDGETWVGTVQVSNAGFSILRTPAAPISAGHPGDTALSLVAGVNMDELRRRLTPDLLSEMGIRQGQERDLFFDVLDALSGDIALSASMPMGPIPQVRLDLGLGDGSAVDRLITMISEEAGPMLQPAEAPGFTQAWQIPTPIGIIRVGKNDGLLVITNQAQLPDPNEPVVTTMDVKPPLRLQIDLPTLTQTLMPLAYGALAGIDEPIGPSAMQRLRWLRWPIADAIRKSQDGSLPPSLSDVFSEGDDVSWAVQSLSQAFPDAADDPVAWIDNHITTLMPQDADADTDSMVIVMHTNRGWSLIDDDWRSAENQLLDDTTFQNRISGMRVMLGKPTADLAIVDLPEEPRFDAGWLPPLDVLVKHMPRYQVTIDDDGQGTLTLNEQGLPLLTTLGGMGSVALWAVERDAARSYNYRLRAKQEEVVNQTHPGLQSGMQAVAHALSRARGSDAGLPAQLSGLVAQGHLDLADCAVMFNGNLLAAATELDRIGRYDTSDKEAVWVVGVDETWSCVVTEWGGVELSRGYPGTPGIPDDIKTVAPAGDPNF